MLSGYGGGENGCWWMTSYMAGVLCLAGKKSFHGYVEVEVFCDFFCFCFCWCWFWEGDPGVQLVFDGNEHAHARDVQLVSFHDI